MRHLSYTASAPFEAARRDAGGWRGHAFELQARAAAGEAGDAEALAQRCAAAVAPLDGSLLNEAVEPPDDPALATALHRRLAADGVAAERIALRSAPDRGAVLPAGGAPRRWRGFRFEAAHRLPQVPAGHPCARMHGHSYRVVLEAEATDAALHALWAAVEPRLRYSCLNDLLANPTSEHLAGWLWAQLRPREPGLRRVHVHETERSACTYDGERYTIWKAEGFEAAVRVPGAGDERSRLHGHGYRLRLHAAAPLDPRLGWVVDYGDLKAAFAPVRERLDHHRLDEIDGLADGDPGTLAAWIAAAVGERLPQLSRIDLLERDGCGAVAYPGAP